MRETHVRALLFILLGFAGAAGQTAPRERPKLKDFGKSLERLRWDEKSRAAAEKPPKAKKQKGPEAGGAEDEEVVRVETSLVVCDVLVLDRQGRAVEGLTREDFLVAEDGRPQEVGTFALGDDTAVPRSIVLVIDYSGSQFPYIRMSVEAAKTLVDRLGPRDLMALVTDDVELIADFTADKERLKKKLDGLARRANEEEGLLAKSLAMHRRFGRSAQFSALLATLKEAFAEEGVRPVVIFQTDGDELLYLRDPVIEPSVPAGLPPEQRKKVEKSMAVFRKMIAENRREFSLRDVYAAAEKSRATIYTVVPGFRLVGLTPDEQLRRRDASRERFLDAWRVRPEVRKELDERYQQTPPEVLKSGIEQELKVQGALVELSSLTGGWADFLEEPGQAAGIYERIFSDVNRRYVIGYYPSNKARDGTRRLVHIEVRGHPEYTVWGRKSYYAPDPDR
ncbi:MAG: VWA domain-containing protein [Acidobacteria bacterium]|nr:VWA domain-containing protein [Acidobacteriota bacterium]